MRMGSPVVFVSVLIAAWCSAQTIDVDITPAHETNRFIPNQTLGAGIDRISVEAIDKDLTPAALKPVFTAGWGAGPLRPKNKPIFQARQWEPQRTGRDAGGRG